ncbi:hypothetical protein [Clostridium kluyveri]|uniref:Uncharacterized protein n=1 Tax=Clostridium kluyveri TaxID=1534 RepID=A0A1L5FC68_CLOKL|nr:hypothetical protein [Clostridium kluyveri]APM40497.1 hypothetical protein BS101_18070 [Clostridium kluyveri]APM40563.1 hypothetical protein BS101_18455 [Clostridium kluyveri]
MEYILVYKDDKKVEQEVIIEAKTDRAAISQVDKILGDKVYTEPGLYLKEEYDREKALKLRE